MIYLLDDKKNRQTDYGWSAERFNKFSSIIKPIYLYEEIEARAAREKIFQETNIILFHESFFDNVLNLHKNEAIEIRNKLYEYAIKTPGFNLVYFSGSKTSRKLEQNIGHIPVSVLYQNLESFIKHVMGDNIDLRYLLFGENYKIEEHLLTKLENANNEIEDSIPNKNPDSKNLIAQTLQSEIPSIFDNADYKTFFLEEKYGNQITDDYLHDLVIEWFSHIEYDNIFIPLCFGPILSDFNGLRLATFIRCTKTPNQLKNVFIYGFVRHEDLIHNEYFDILKTRNVSLIAYKKLAFLKSVLSSFKPLDKDALVIEMRKIKLEPPKDYEDKHSIANEWAIYRWARAIDANDDEIYKIIYRVNKLLYFKYLNTIFPRSGIGTIKIADLKLHSSKKPKILYIDDEAEKGWYEVFCKIFYDINLFSFQYLDDEFNSLTREEIITLSLNKIKTEDIDIVLLDFRLHQNDFNTKSIEEITGVRLLSEIKKLNPGIQVIIFSATNKVWNFQALREAGADGFILKESPENSIDPLFTTDSIKNIIRSFQACILRLFLKDFYNNLDSIKAELIPRKNYKKSHKPLPADFVDEVIEWLALSYNILRYDINKPNKTAAFLFLFSVLENLSSRIIDIDNPIIDDRNQEVYMFEFRNTNKQLMHFMEDIKGSGYYIKTNNVLKSGRSIPWTQKILNTLDFVNEEQLLTEELSKIIKKRNDFIHANTTTGQTFEIDVNMLITLNSIVYKGIINVV